MNAATKFDLNAHFQSLGEREKPMHIFPRIVCKDGFSISVQAHRGAYCSPRYDEGPWYRVECGFPSAHPGDELMKYVEDADAPTETVYGYVPVEVVERLIEAHGGVA